MADIARGRSAKPSVDFRLEGKQRENMVKERLEFLRAARPPDPYGGRDIFHNRQVRQNAAHTLCDTMAKIRAVDQDENVRRRLYDRGNGLSDAAQDQRQLRDHLTETHRGDIAHAE